MYREVVVISVKLVTLTDITSESLNLTRVWYEILRIPGEKYPVYELPIVLLRLWQTSPAFKSCSYLGTEHIFWIFFLNFTCHRFLCVASEFIDCFERLATSGTLIGNSMDSV